MRHRFSLRHGPLLFSFIVLLGLIVAVAYWRVKTPSAKTLSGEGVIFTAYHEADHVLGWLFARTDIYAVDMTGTEFEAPLVIKEPEYPDEFEWSPDGQWLVYSSAHLSHQAGGNSEIYIKRADGRGESVNVTSSPERDLHPTWSPDGTHITFLSLRDTGSGIYLMNVECVLQTNSPCSDPVFLVDGDHPDWSPDGKRIVYEGRYPSPLDGDILAVEVDGKSEPIKISPEGKFCYWPRWSPDGARIVFACGGGLYTVNPEGGELMQLIDDCCKQPQWSPDGSQIAFIGGRELDASLGNPVGVANLEVAPPRSNAIFVIDADGTNLRRLTLNNYQVIGEFRWLPKGFSETQP